MCGVIGLVGQSRVNQSLFDGLTILQHRGQDAAGIMTSDQNRIYLRKANGLVRDAIRTRHMKKCQGNIGIGHVRYPTAGSDSVLESQPFYVNSPWGMGLVHNGNLTNASILKQTLVQQDLRHLNTESDSEVLLNVLAHELAQVAHHDFKTSDLFSAVEQVYNRVEGAYSVITLIQGRGLLAFRDPHGIRPLIYGKRQTEHGLEWMIASESIAIDALGFTRVADFEPGEAIFFDINGTISKWKYPVETVSNPCLFEYIYLARADSIINRIPVYHARLNMGQKLAELIQKEHADLKIDAVIPIPDTSRTSALRLAQALKLPYSEGFVKNRYIGRTFIMPGQSIRRASVQLKLSAIEDEFKGKNVLLVDDSIVRGTTSKGIVQMARDMGARSVYFASAAPKIIHPNVYGIDMPSSTELIAYQRSDEEIAAQIGADRVIYQSLYDVCDAVNLAAKKTADQIDRFEDSVFTGSYVSGNINQAYLSRLEEKRHDKRKQCSGESVDEPVSDDDESIL